MTSVGTTTRVGTNVSYPHDHIREIWLLRDYSTERGYLLEDVYHTSTNKYFVKH